MSVRSAFDRLADSVTAAAQNQPSTQTRGMQIQSKVESLVPGIIVTSGKRTPEKNRQVGGVSNSYHLTDEARDFVPPKGMTMSQLYTRLSSSMGDEYDVINENDHIHIEPKGRRVANQTNQGGRPVTNPSNYNRWLDSVLPAETKATSPVTLPDGAAEVIFGSEGQIVERQAGVENALDAIGTQIDVVKAATEAAQAVQTTQKIQQVEDARRINQEILAGTDQLKRQVTPVMEARTRVANQLDELATMNPLERGLRSIFDLNYDTGYLTKQLELFDRTLQARMYDFQYIDTLQNIALREIDRRYGIETAISGLEVEQGAQDLALLNQKLSLASQLLGSTRDSLATQSQLIVAQTQARENILGRLDLPTLAELTTQAQTNGGEIDYHGVKFTATELRDAGLARERQEREIRMHQMAVANGEMNLAEGIARDIAAGLTLEQLEEAAANGGVWNGIQLPQDVITNGIENFRQRSAAQAEQILLQMPSAVAVQTNSDIISSFNSLSRRVNPILSPADKRNASTIGATLSELSRQLVDAVNTNQPPAVVQAILAKMSQTQQTYQSQVSQAILRSVGGDKQAAGYVESFVYGTPLNPGTATEALTYFALKGGLPDGLAVSPEARQVFIRAQQIANAARQEDPKISFDRLQATVQRELGDYAASIVGTPRLNDVISSLPAHAKSINHPLGRISNTWWRQTYTDAKNYAASELAQILKTTPANVVRMMQTMSPIDTTPASTTLFENFMNQAGQANALEQELIVERLNSINPLEPGKSNSELFEELLYSPEFHRNVNRTMQTIEGNSFGDYLIGPMTQGAAQSALVQYAGSISEAASANRVKHITAARNAAKGWGFSPRARVLTILTSIPSVGEAGAAKLMPFLNQHMPVGREVQGMASAMGGPPGSAWERPGAVESFGAAEELRILDALRNAKFDDPATEAYRKAAIQHWSEYSQLSDTIINNFTRAARK